MDPKCGQTKPIPDGGYGWAVVFGFALSNIFNNSLLSVFGLLFSEQLSALGLNTSGAALVLNINIIVLNLSGFLTKQISQNYSLRSMFLVGCLFSSLGICLSSRATTIPQIFLFYGVPVGLGQGLMNSSGFLAVNLYFERNRGKALGLALAGTGIGQVIMPFVVKELLDEYGYRGATLIIGGLSLHGLVGGCLLLPVKTNKNIHKEEEKKLLEPESPEEDLDENSNLLKRDDKKMDMVRESNWSEKLHEMFGTQLLRDKIFLNISIGIALIYTVSINFSLLFPYYLQETALLSRGDAAFVMTVLAAGDVLSRLTVPIFTDKYHISARTTLLVGISMLIVVRACLAETGSLSELIIISATFGFIRATTVLNQSLSLAEYFPDNKQLSSAVGLTMILKAIAVITVGQLLGLMRDLTNSYTLSLHLQNAVLLLVVISWSAELVYKKCSKRSQFVEL